MYWQGSQGFEGATEGARAAYGLSVSRPARPINPGAGVSQAFEPRIHSEIQLGIPTHGLAADQGADPDP